MGEGNVPGDGVPLRHGRLRLLRPLRKRDFALLWTGLSVSMLGDGLFFVALAFQVYELSDSPTSLALVWLTWALAMVACLLLGGVVSDRFDRRRVMIAADLARMVALVGLGTLSVAGVLEVWHCAAIIVLYGAGEAFFMPAFAAIVPTVVEPGELVQANALDEFVRPFCLYLAGPAVGGLTVAAVGPGTAFLIDAGTFLFAMTCVALMRVRRDRVVVAGSSFVRELREGFAFVRATPWLWGTLMAAAIALLCFFGPVEVLLPFVVKNEYGGGPEAFGFVLAAGGAGSILAALIVGQRDLPRRHVTVMYAAWIIASATIAGYGLVATTWQAMMIATVYGAGITVGMVVWRTLMQTHVPGDMLGRVSSLDSFVSAGLMPVSFALVGPVAALVGAKTTLIGGGVLASVSTLVIFLALPSMRDVERLGERGEGGGEAGIAHLGGVEAEDLDAVLRG